MTFVPCEVGILESDAYVTFSFIFSLIKQPVSYSFACHVSCKDR